MWQFDPLLLSKRRNKSSTDVYKYNGQSPNYEKNATYYYKNPSDFPFEVITQLETVMKSIIILLLPCLALAQMPCPEINANPCNPTTEMTCPPPPPIAPDFCAMEPPCVPMEGPMDSETNAPCDPIAYCPTTCPPEMQMCAGGVTSGGCKMADTCIPITGEF